MAVLSKEMIGEIRQVAELYAKREIERLQRANNEAVERLRVNDPTRYKAIQDRQFVVKVYHDELGCIEEFVTGSSTEALEYIRLDLKHRGSEDEHDYRYYGPDGKEIPLDIHWIPQVRCK